jgi:hypothetical protein
MRKAVVIGLAALPLTLAVAGVAVARLSQSGTAAVAASFSATTQEAIKTRTCNGPDGQYQFVDAVYRGASTSSEARLNGDARIRIHSVYNATKQIGWASGLLRLEDSNAMRFDAVNSNGKLSGFVRGRVEDGGGLAGTFSADFSSTGIANGQLGGGAGTLPNVAVLAGRICTGAPPPNKSVKLEVEGTIATISPTSVSVAPEDSSVVQTCALGTGSPNVSGFTKDQKVEMTCATVNGTLTVVRLKKRG